mmetsp:Transcript_27943/g.65708  ORF Transcript_27943/g.65708 Transcript_27943/m.65708 type:complete len:248 (-) Transcript_27943:489-1232(-)
MTALAPRRPLRRRPVPSGTAIGLRVGKLGTVPSLRVASMRSRRYFLPRTPRISRTYLALSSYKLERAPYLTSSSTKLPPKESMLSSSARTAEGLPVAGRDRYSMVARYRTTCFGAGGAASSSSSSSLSSSFPALPHPQQDDFGSSVLISSADRFLFFRFSLRFCFFFLAFSFALLARKASSSSCSTASSSSGVISPVAAYRKLIRMSAAGSFVQSSDRRPSEATPLLLLSSPLASMAGRRYTRAVLW